MFKRVLVPQAVRDELKEFYPELPKFVEFRPATGANQCLSGTELLGPGEAEALLIARELNARLILIDDRKDRPAAHQLAIPCIGLFGFLVSAKRPDRNPPFTNIFNCLKRTADCTYRTRLLPMLSTWLANCESWDCRDARACSGERALREECRSMMRHPVATDSFHDLKTVSQ